MMRRLPAFLAFLAALILGPPAQAQRAGDFDYFVLSLSWSPTFCEVTGSARNEPQCAPARPRAFVLHGLWPQYTRGYPEFCAGRNPPRIPEALISRMLDIMPSRGLIIHEWRRHGTCSGLDPQSYFDTARRAFTAISIPAKFQNPQQAVATTEDELVDAFASANPSLTKSAITLSCRTGRLEEIRVCLSRTLQPRRCAESTASACRSGTISLPGAPRL